jgi:hypothetical protein
MVGLLKLHMQKWQSLLRASQPNSNRNRRDRLQVETCKEEEGIEGNGSTEDMSPGSN